MDAQALKAWHDRLHNEADLSRSYKDLDGDESFLAESLRGRLAMLSADWRKAAHHLRAANRKLRDGAECSLPHALLHHAYCREASLLAGRNLSPSAPAPIAGITTPSLLAVMSGHRLLDAAELLAAGRPKKARACLRDLLRRQNNSHYTLTFLHLGLCACAANEGKRARALRHLEIAGLHAMAVEQLLGRVRIAPRLMVLYEMFGRSEEAKSWHQTLASLPCPESTKLAMTRRAEMIARKFRTAGLLLLV